MSNLLSKTDILGADDLGRELVEIPEWDGCVWVSGMNAAERSAFEARGLQAKETKKYKDFVDYKNLLTLRSIRDEKGDRLFEDKELPELVKKSSKALGRIFNAMASLSGLSKEDIEELEKNSEKTQPSDSLID